MVYVKVVRRKKKWKIKKGYAHAKKKKWTREKRPKSSVRIKDKKPTVVKLQYTRDKYGRLVPKKKRKV